MGRKLDWEKAARYDRETRARADTPRPPRETKREIALDGFAVKHSLLCFACGGLGPWAKSGISKRGPWIICVACVNKRPAGSAPVAHR